MRTVENELTAAGLIALLQQHHPDLETLCNFPIGTCGSSDWQGPTAMMLAVLGRHRRRIVDWYERICTQKNQLPTPVTATRCSCGCLRRTNSPRRTRARTGGSTARHPDSLHLSLNPNPGNCGSVPDRMSPIRIKESNAGLRCGAPPISRFGRTNATTMNASDHRQLWWATPWQSRVNDRVNSQGQTTSLHSIAAHISNFI